MKNLLKTKLNLLILLTATLIPMTNAQAGLAIIGSGAGTYVAYEASLLPLGYGMCAMKGECGGGKAVGFLSFLIGVVLLDGESGVEPSFGKISKEEAIELRIEEPTMDEFNETTYEVNIQKRNVSRALSKLENPTLEDADIEWEKRQALLPASVYEVVSRIRHFNSSVEVSE